MSADVASLIALGMPWALAEQVVAPMPTADLDATVAADQSAVVVRTDDPHVTIMRGLVAGVSYDTKFGRNRAVDSGGEDVWEGGGTYTGFPLTSLETVIVTSSSDDDAAAGTGARTARLTGLDGNYDVQTEDVTLNGTTGVTTTKTWRRLSRVAVLTAGSNGSNVGTLTVKHTTTTANVFATVTAGQNQTGIACWTVPAGYTAYIRRIYAAGARANGSVVADIQLRIRETGGVFLASRLFTVGNNLTVNIEYNYGIRLPEKTDVKMRVESASASNGDFAAEFEYVLIAN